MKNNDESQIHALFDLLNALDENTAHILSLLNENLEREYEDRADLAIPKQPENPASTGYEKLAGKKILVVDDIELNRVLLSLMLKNIGMEVVEAENGHDAIELLQNSKPDEISLILMDIMMPVMDGIEAMVEIRKISNVPVILLTAKSEDTDKVLGLTVGADDYVTKPFNPVELQARVKSQIRRYMLLGAGNTSAGKLVIGGIELDDKSKTVTVDGEAANLTRTEYDILKLLMEHPGEVYSPNQIYAKVWKDEPYGTENTVAVHIRHLREKVEINPAEPRYLKVIWGRGYKIDAE